MGGAWGSRVRQNLTNPPRIRHCIEYHLVLSVEGRSVRKLTHSSSWTDKADDKSFLKTLRLTRISDTTVSRIQLTSIVIRASDEHCLCPPPPFSSATTGATMTIRNMPVMPSVIRRLQTSINCCTRPQLRHAVIITATANSYAQYRTVLFPVTLIERPITTPNHPIFSERELTFTFAICYRPSVCLSVVCRM